MRIKNIYRKTGIDPKFLAGCYGKIRYETYAAAKEAAESLGNNLNAYKCRFAKGDTHYHKGRMPWRK